MAAYPTQQINKKQTLMRHLALGRKPQEERFLHKNTNKKTRKDLWLQQGNAQHCSNYFFWTWPPRGSKDGLQEKCQLEYSQFNKNKFFFFFFILMISFSWRDMKCFPFFTGYTTHTVTGDQWTIKREKPFQIYKVNKSEEKKNPVPSSLPCKVSLCIVLYCHM